VSYRPLPRSRPSRTWTCDVSGCKLYLTAGQYEDGSLGEISVRVAKQGSTLGGLMEAFCSVVSLALQHGVQIDVICDRMCGVRFDPSGWSNDPDIPDPESIIDWIFRRLRTEFVMDQQENAA
jgi:ribonucleoside-diphosphate reductase alpha chain